MELSNYASQNSEAIESKIKFIEGFPYSTVETVGNWQVYTMANDPTKKIAKYTYRDSGLIETSTMGLYFLRDAVSDVPFAASDIKLFYAKGGTRNQATIGMPWAEIRGGDANCSAGVWRTNTVTTTAYADVDVYIRNFSEGAV